jgi:hypothetical protein
MSYALRIDKQAAKTLKFLVPPAIKLAIKPRNQACRKL